MEATALIEPLTQAHVRPGVRVSECRVFRGAVTIIARHTIDDEFLQRRRAPRAKTICVPICCRSAPNARMFLVSQWGSPPTYWKALSPAQRRAYGSSSPQGPCQFLTPEGKPVPKELSRLDRIIHHYEAQLNAACTRTPRCTYDDGAFGRQIDNHKFTTEDLNHVSVKGHAAAAAVAWSTI
jgi:hypothetical protein